MVEFCLTNSDLPSCLCSTVTFYLSIFRVVMCVSGFKVIASPERRLEMRSYWARIG